MRVRFLKSGHYDGFKTIVVDGMLNIEDSRIFFEHGQNFEIRDYFNAKDGLVDIILLDDSVYRVNPHDIEISVPTPFTPSQQQCCKK